VPPNKACILLRKKLKNWLNRENQIIKKKLIKLIKILKKPIGSVQFRFYKSETEKTELNPNRKNRKKTESNKKKPNQTGKNRVKPKNKPNQFELVFILKNKPKPVGLNRFWFFYKKIRFDYFFYKNWIEPKIITPIFIFPS